MNRLPFATLAILLAVPGCAQPWNDQDSWAFEVGPDDFRPDAVLDLRSLNEKVAGEKGFVKTDGKGDFVRGDGQPIRFWCVVSDVGREKPWTARPLGRKSEPDLARHARFLAKRGVNMVRLHAQVAPSLEKNPSARITDINESERDWIWRAVAAYKKEGIYTTISPYWGVPMKFGNDWGYPGGHEQSALGLLFFEPTLQTAYKVWLRKLFAESNPYTGIPLAKDASVALIQLQNEDSLFFWTVNGIQGEPRKAFGKQFGTWLRTKYGSIANATARWEGNSLPGDNAAEGVFDFHNIWEMTQARTGGFAKRLDDQTEFWARTQHGFNAAMLTYLRETLGCGQLLNATNWKTANPVRLNDIERWTYTANEVDAVNFYYGGVHKGPTEGWAIQVGDKFTSESILKNPRPFPLNLKQTVNRPMLITESAWVMPNAYASEGPLLVAAYQSLSGIDGYYWFATGDDEWTHPTSGNGYMPSQAKWLYGNPDMLGSFPAAALMYRMGYVKRGLPVVVENRSLLNLWQRKTPIIGEEASFDPNRDTGDIAPTSSVRAGVDPAAYQVGPVQVRFDADPAQTVARPLTAFVGNGVLRSNTGEVVLDTKVNACTVNAPKSQGVAAFFGNKATFDLADVSFTSKNAYGSAIAVSMDGLPLKESKKILVQFVTQSRPTDWAEAPAEIKLDDGQLIKGLEVKSYGKAPWRVKRARLDVTVRNAGITRVRALDMNGNAGRAVAFKRDGAAIQFSFPSDRLYVVLDRPG
jgi:hypothetical protein